MHRSRSRSLSLLAAALAACSVPDKISGDGGAPPPDVPDQPSGPETTLTSTPATKDNSPSATFEFHASIADAIFECALDGAAFVGCASPKKYTSLAAGTHHFEVRAIDRAGIPDATPASFDWTIDLSSPNVTIDSGPTGPIASKSATFTFSASNAGAGPTFTCTIDGSSGPCTSPASYSGLAERAHTFVVGVTTAAGISDPTPASATWTVDVTPPITTIGDGPTGTVMTSSATFAFSAGEPATFSCTVDQQPAAACTSPYTVSEADGPHTFSVLATDLAGNVAAAPAQRTWTIDTVGPTTTITSTPPDSTQSLTATFAFTSEAGATFACQVDGGGFTTCTSPFTTATLAEGLHGFEVRATDAAGNVGGAPFHGWTIDRTPPTTSITGAPPALAASTTAAFTFDSNEPGTFQCKLDSGNYAACPASDTLTGLGQGTHQLFVRAVDLAGNVDPNPVPWSWTVDSVAPTTTITSGPPTPNHSGVTTFTFTSNEGTSSFECALDTAAFAACSSPYATWIDDGAHTMHVRARDGAGNLGAAAAYTWTSALANLVFVTYTGTSTGTNLGGLAGADNICAAKAQAAGLHGTYRAWLSTSTVDAIDRLGSARGWVRVDGKPFVDTQADLAAGKILYPPVLDATGARTEYSGVLTGTDPSGRYAAAGGSCLDWTSTDNGKSYQGGVSSWGTGFWTRSISVPCAPNWQVVLYCMGVDRQTAVAPPAATVRHVFASSGTWTPGGGLAGADAVCASEASAAGLSGTFKAALPTPTAGVLARFSSGGAPWARVDGVLITATTAALYDPQLQNLDAPVNVTASGQYLDGYNAPFSSNPWTGPRLTGSQTTCASWTSGASTDRGDVGSIATTPDSWVFADNGGSQCDTALHLLCMQQ